MGTVLICIFTKDGDYAKRLNHAIEQVDEWEDWIKRNENYFKNVC